MLPQSISAQGESDMLAQTKIDEIERLLTNSRLSQRAIALRVGVSRTVVADIAKGAWERRVSDSRRADIAGCPRRHCPTCGYLVPLPCESMSP